MEFTAQASAQCGPIFYRAGFSESSPQGNSHTNDQTDPTVCSNPAEIGRSGIKSARLRMFRPYWAAASLFSLAVLLQNTIFLQIIWTNGDRPKRGRQFRQPIKTGSTWGQSRLRSVALAVAAPWQTFVAACVPLCHLAECWECKAKAAILWLFFSRSTSELSAATTAGSLPAWSGLANQQSASSKLLQKSRNLLKMKIEMRWVGWGAFPGWRSSLQEAAARAADCSLANDPFRKLI